MKILAVGAHPDDIELGCGGTLCEAARGGGNPIAIFVTKGERSGDANIRMNESIKALGVLGVKEVYFGDFPDTEVSTSHEVIDFLEKFCAKYEPDMVLTHTVNDTHQDHRQVAWHSFSAFRNVPKILAYETPRVTPAFYPNYFVDISGCIEQKWEALKRHLSQNAERYLTYQSMVNLATFRGSQANVSAAEAFEVVRYVERL